MGVRKIAPTPTPTSSSKSVTVYVHAGDLTCAPSCIGCERDLLRKPHHVLWGSAKCDTCIAIDIFTLSGRGFTVKVVKEE